MPVFRETASPSAGSPADLARQLLTVSRVMSQPCPLSHDGPCVSAAAGRHRWGVVVGLVAVMGGIKLAHWARFRASR
jgi:hypothetical protein